MDDKVTYRRDMNNTQVANVIKEILERAYSFQSVALVEAFLSNRRSYENICAILYDE